MGMSPTPEQRGSLQKIADRSLKKKGISYGEGPNQTEATNMDNKQKRRLGISNIGQSDKLG